MSKLPIVIIGGGVAGLAVAKGLSENGFASIIVEKEDRIGGKVVDWACMATDRCLRCFCCSVQDLIQSVMSSSNVSTLPGWELSGMGRENPFSLRIALQSRHDQEQRVYEAAAIVVATGFKPYDPTEKLLLGYGKLRGVFTLKDLNAFVREDNLAGFASGTEGPLRVAFVQCVGSRDKTIGADYCSQYCCQAALKMAIKMKSSCPDWEVVLFYIDLQLAGKMAPFLVNKASEMGISLMQGVPGEITELDDGILAIVRENNGVNTREHFHRVVLSIGQRPSDSTARIKDLLAIATDRFGFLGGRDFYHDARTSVPGVYVAGTCGAPMNVEETLMSAGRAAGAIIADLEVLGRNQS